MPDKSRQVAGLSPERLQRLIERLQGKAVAETARTIAPRPAGLAPVPTSFSQERLWFLEQLEPGTALYNVPAALRLRGELRIPALAAALNELVARHESLRTTFAEAEGRPHQVIAPAAGADLPRIDLSALPEAAREAELGRLAAGEARRPFDLARGPLLRASLVRLSGEDHAFVCILHHIISDGWSVGILIRELSALYEAFSAGRPSPLPALPIQYADFAVWQREHLGGEALAARLAYWRERLAGLPPLDLPTDRPRTARAGERSTSFRLRLSAGLTGRVHALALEAGATPFMVLLSVFEILLSRLSGQTDLTVGTPVAGRHHAEAESLIGFFVNTLVLRGSLAEEPSFADLLAATRRYALEAYSHQDLPFEKLVELLQPDRHLGRTPLFQASFALQNAPAETLRLPGLAVELLPVESGTAKFDLTLALAEDGDGLAGDLIASADLFEEETIRRWAGCFEHLLSAALAAPGTSVFALPLLGEAERRTILGEWSSAGWKLPAPALIHEIFAEQAARTPGKAAAVCQGTAVTYRELDERAGRLARRLAGFGKPGLVGLMAAPDLPLLTGMLGILKAGSGFVPLDPGLPAERLERMIADCGLAVLAADRRSLARAEEIAAGAHVVCLEDDLETLQPADAGPGDGTAYVIFTSGSTGVPKGVPITHENLVPLLLWSREVFGFGEHTRVLQSLSYAFDFGVFEILTTLLFGGTLFLRGDAERSDVEGYLREVREHAADTLHTTPSFFRAVAAEAGAAGLPTVRVLHLGGEALTEALVAEAFRVAGPECRVFNGYGPTEAAVNCALYDVGRAADWRPRGLSSLPIGHPSAENRLYVLDRRLEPVPPGVPGELLVGGGALSRGYLGRPDLTAARFLPDPFGEPGGRLYRTGDLVRFHPDRAIEFLGRVDNQVKVRGYRIELEEIEAALAAHPEVGASAVVAARQDDGEARLLAYVAARRQPAPGAEELCSFLGRTLPAYMIPAVFTFLPELPLNVSGKVDRKALPAPEETAAAERVAPRTPLEELLAGLWQELLGREEVGVRDNFFALGGHSLLATRLLTRVRTALGVDLPVRLLFEAPTVEALAAAIEALAATAESSEGGPSLPPLPALLLRPRQPGEGAPLSFSQERLWFLDQMDPGAPTYNIPGTVGLTGRLDVAALAAALRGVVDRHEVLRTVFRVAGGEPRQHILPAVKIGMPVVDLAALPPAGRRAEAERLASEHARHRFDLSRGPLLDAALLRLEAERHHLHVVLHHVICDGWALALFVREVGALYAAFASGRPSPLAALPIQYADFAVWQREVVSGSRQAELAWWMDRLGGEIAPLELPTDRARPPVQTYRGGSATRLLPAGLAARMNAFAQAQGATLFMTLLAAIQALLHRHSGQDDILVGAPVAGRRAVETEELIGCFLNTLVLRTGLGGRPGFRELVARVREATLGAYSHQDVPFEAVLARMPQQRDLSRTPLFQVMVNLLNLPSVEMSLPGLALESLGAAAVPSKLDMTFYAREGGDGLRISLVYNADLFDAARMEDLLSQLEQFLDQALERPGEPVGALSLVTAAARAVLPDPAAELSAAWEGAVHEVFARRARSAPGALAAADPAESWTYGELDLRSDRLAAFLHASGVGPGDVVAFWAHRSAPLVWGVLGALKAGAAFLMLDPRYPAPRQAQMLGIARPAAWLQVAAAGPVPAEIESALEAIGCACRLTLPARAEDPGFLADAALKPPAVEAGPDDVAYVAFTSGSTGVPKGVLGRHGSLSHFIPWLTRRFELTAADRFSMLSGLAHDPLHRDLFTPLQIGAAVVIPDPETMDEPGRLAAWMRREGVTVAHLTPALGQVLTTEAPNRPRVEVPSLRYAFLVGDVLTRRDVARLRRLAPAVTCVNYYGSTETQRAVGYHVAREDEPREVLPLGRGIPDVQLLVRNPAGALAGLGELGEVSVRSPHIALGYLGDPELTAERFVDGHYRTGDLGRYLPDGEVVFAGRADTQVKIRGFRIELGEIESVLGGFPGVREAVVLARRDRGPESYLAAYVVPAPGAALAARELRAYLRERLPDSMVPATFTLLAELPLTPNRKVDRKALPAPDRGAEEAAFVAPETDLEQEIAAVWQEVLDVPRVGLHDNFFEIGGHSLLLVRLHSRLQEALKVDLPLMDLFSHPNVRAQAEHIRGRSGARRAALPERQSPAPPGGRLAIVGMAGRFPGAGGLEAFWQNLRQGVESISFFSEEELLRSGVPLELVQNPSYVPARAVVDGEDLFDAAFFDIPPRQAELMDPQLRFFLETAWHALESAGIDPETFPGAIGLYGGVTVSSYLLSNLLSHPGLLQEMGPGPLLLGTDRDFLTTQVSYRLGLRGPSLDVQTACSTSLVATHLACQALLTGDCDVALAGGVSIKVPQRAGYVYQESGPDSSDGHCRAFDAKADGSIYGAGVGLVVLKRLEDALADGDAIHAVILGSGVNNDGSQKVGYTAPSIEGQAAVVASALARAGVEPATIDYVECHGSGTALGDPIEVTALSRAFGDTGKRGSCAIGSVKTNIGHLGAAAGVTGLIKTVLALEHREIPPSLHFETPNPKIDFAASPFRVNDRLSPWPANGRPRRAGVSSLGQGGTNAHVVLEEAPAREPSGPSRPWQLLVLSARTATALEAATGNLAAWLEGNPDASLADAAFTLQVGRRAFAHRRAVVCRGVDEARRILEERDPRRLLTGVRDGGRRPVAFLLAGVGDHYPGMARGLYETEPVFRAALDRCFEILADGPWRDLREAVFAGGERAAEGGLDLRRMLGRGDGPDEAARRLHRTLYAQPAVFAVEHALAQLWMSWGVEPEALLGYSLGEYVAACLAGVFPLEDALPLVAERARWIEELPAGAMLAVPLPEDETRARLSPGLDVAAVNGPQLSVVSGPPEEVAALAGRLVEEGIAARQLPTTHAFHSRGMEPLAERLTERVRRLRPAAPQIPLLSNVTGTWMTAGEATDPAYWARHLSRPVRFSDGLAELWKNPSRVLLEVGPGQGLSALALQHPAAGRGRTALPSLPHAHERQDDAAFLLGTLGRLWLAGAAIDWAGLWRGERRHRLELPLYPFERRRFWVEPAQSGRVEPALLSTVEEEQTPAPSPLALHERPRLPNAWEAPRNETEAWVAGQIERLLGIAGVGAHDSFFELGGHSLLGTRLLSRLRDELGVELSIAALFESPTPAELAARIEPARGSAPEAEPIERLPRNGLPADLPLSFTQERIWFLDQLDPGSAAYNIPTAIRLEGPLDAAALAGALSGVARRHETLCTTFPTVHGVPVQRIAPPCPFPLAVVDLSGLPEAAREAEGARLAVEEPRAPFDLANGPLARASLVRLGERGHLLLATQHHIISDGWSLGLFVREVASLYRAFTSGEVPALPELPVQYADFASWQRRRLSGPGLEGQMDWWRERLTPPPPVLALPADRPRPAVETFRGGRQPLAVPAELTAALTALGRGQGATLFMTLLAGFDTLLGRLADQEDLAVGSPIAGRTRGEVEALIGVFINTLVLRTSLAGDPTFRETVARVRETALGAYAHQELPFERLVEELRPERSLGHSPLFQALFILQNLPAEELSAPGLTLRPLSDIYHGVARFDLTLSATEIEGGLRGYLEFKADLLDAATAARWLGHLGALLTAAVAEPGRRLSELPLLSDAERRQILDDWNDTAAELPAAPVHRSIAERAARSPEEVAVVYEGERLTRAELEERAARLAGRLRALGIGPESLVGIALERSLDLLVAVLGVWKAGGAYLPLDPGYPAERIGFMLADSGVRVVLTHERLAATLPEHGARVLCLDFPGTAAEPVDDGGAGPEHLAYVLYTSGSTGRPKGVQVTHGALANFLASMLREPGLAESDVLLAVTSLSFDIAGLELYLPLLAGARLEIASAELAADGARLAARLHESGATVLQATPATWRMLLEAGWEGGLRLALCGGEALPGDLAAHLERRAGAVWNLYGPTETTVWSAAFPVEGDVTGIVPIGRPIANTRIYVLDRSMDPVPPGLPGEAWIGGAGVARGYLGRPDLTAERFGPDPFSEAPGARLYRTGDLSRIRPNGTLEFLGRADHQVKIRGHRIETGEIEAALGLHPAVAQAAVVARDDRGDRRLVAYVVPAAGQKARTAELRAFLRERLPEFMEPSAFITLAALPLTPNRKVDRRALPAPEAPAADTAAGAFVAPRNFVEEVLAGFWAEVLGVERVGIDDDFFALGGHSLLATRIASRVARVLGTAPPVRWIFERPTVRGLGERIAQTAGGEGHEPEPPITPVARTGDLPLSFSQERLWFLDRFQPDGTAYNMPVALRLDGDLNVPALAAALAEIVRRHEALRTSFPESDGLPRQEIAPPAPVPLPLLDLSGLSAGRRHAELALRLAAEARRPFDLHRGPLLCATLLRLGARDHALALATHHIVGDAWSMGLFVRELSTLYCVAARGERSPLPELPVQYADFASWQRRWLTGERLGRLAAAWRARLDGAPAALELPTDRPHPPVQTFRGGNVAVRLRRELASGIEALTRREGASLFMTLLAAFQTLLHRYSGQEDLVVGTPVAGRSRPEIEGLIGVFLNTLPLRGALYGDPGFRELLARTRETALEAYTLQDLPFETLLTELQPPRDLSRPPLFQTMLILQNAPAEALSLPGLSFTLVPVETGTAKLELLLSLAQGGGEIGGYLEYNADLFDRSTGGRLARHFETLVAGAVKDPETPLSELPLLTPGEREQLVRGWNHTAVPWPGASVHELFETQADSTPGALAVLAGGERLTFAELDARANRLAHHLRGLGVGPEVLVGLSVERSAAMVVALLGILKAGGAYLPLDPSYPRERLAHMLKDSAARVVVTEEALLGSLPPHEGTTVLLDGDAGEISRRPAERLGDAPDPGALAYVLYTSGSTGRPKGVQVPHGALVNFLLSMRERPGMGEGDVLVAVTSLSFDIAGLEIYLPLLTGATLVVATREEVQDGALLERLLARSSATVLQATPATWRLLTGSGWTGAPGLRALCGGEALPEDLAAALLERSGAVWNLYGPTETTIWSTVSQVLPRRTVSIGHPIANTTAHLLDPRGSLVPVGVPGELLLGGAGVTRGYLGRPDLTAERFVPDPFGEPGARLYRTGDLVRRRPDGSLEFLGRLDHQVKVRGFRIEPGEIEAALCSHPAVAQAVAVVSGSEAGARLTAHLVPRGPVDLSELRSFVAKTLPAYMVPGAFVEHGALPLTPNGKIDRKALARLAAPAAPAAAAPTPPASPLEEAVAALWAEVLGAGRVGPQDDFFALGGHSILATLLMHRVRQSFGVDLPLRTLFAAPTVAGLAAAISAHRAEGGEAGILPAEMPRIVPAPEGRSLPFPLTDVQEAYWIGRSGALELGSVATHVYFELDATGLDLPRFENAVRRLVERHGMLRAIVQPDGRQRILPEVPPYRITTVDLSGADAAAAGEARLALRGHLSHQVLPSDRWPLFELAAARLPEGRMRLYVSLDMLIGDAWSLRLLGRDLGRLYENPGAALPPLEISFRDYVLAEAALRETAAYRRDLDYWRGRLAGIPPAPQLPLAKSPAEVRTPRFVRRAGRLAPEAWSRLKERTARAGLTPSGALLAAWSEVLAAWTGTSRFTLNLTLFNRLPLHPQVDELVGDFTSLTLLAVERRPGEPFVEQARRTQRRLWDDLDHRLVSGVRVLRELSRLGREPRTMMPVVFTSTLNQAAQESRPAGGKEVRSEDAAWAITQTPQVWLDHQVAESGGALTWQWDAVEELFPAGLLDDMFAAYGRLVERLAESEEAWREPVRGLLPEAQLRLLEEVNATAAPVPAGLLYEPFLEQARRTPEAPAVLTSSRTVTYGELDRLSRVLAGRLQRLGARPNRLVAVVMHKGWEQVAAVLAVLRAGAAYLPLDARLPAERLRHLLARGEVAVALTQPGLEHSLPWPEGVERVVVDAALEAAEEGPSIPLPTPEDLAYVIFTSGSTGEPKGVMIDHRGALNTVADVNRRFAVGPGDRVLALSSLSFDLSVWDVFGLLSAGGAVVVPDAGTERDPEHWAALASRERVTVWNTVPALMEMLVEHAAGRPGALAAPLRAVLLSGDWIPVRLPGRIRSAFPGARVISLGGATEASIWSILYPISEVGEGWASIPYGRPLDNQRFHVLDEDLEPAPVWVPGHLYIGGLGLARGYWRDEEKTAAAFLVHPRTGERLYRTGDLGRLLPDGDIEFLGRDDTQVKVQGHRIELGEIEAVLAHHPAVGAAVVSAVGEARGAKQLAAYVVLAGEQAAPSRPAVISDPVERLRFKLAHHNLRPDEGRPAVALRRPGLSPEQMEALYVRRRSYRRFLREALPLDDLAGFLAGLAPVPMEGLPFPKHRYGSAGSLYPVQTYLHVKEGRVEGLAGGLYYHDPERHRLVLLAGEGGLDASLWDPVNRGVFEESAFAVFLIARLAAITPLYGERARHFAALEAGLMTQLLEMSAPDYGLGLAQMGGLRFEAVRPRFALDETCELMHTLLGGRIAPEQARLAALQADMAEQRALVQLVEQQPDRAELPAVARTDAAVFAGLREHLRAHLPEYMLPAHFVRIEEVPLSANGKVDRKALPAPEALEAEARPAAVPYAPPETETEQVVARVVAQVLGVPRVGLYDNFFDLGANSVQVVRVHNALREALGAEIPIVEVFNHPSVSLLARRLSQSAGSREPEGTAAADPGAERVERLREGKDWRRQRLQKRKAAGGL